VGADVFTDEASTKTVSTLELSSSLKFSSGPSGGGGGRIRTLKLWISSLLFYQRGYHRCLSTKKPGNPHRRGRPSTFDLLVLTNLRQLLFLLKILFTFFTKQATLIRRLVVLRPCTSVSVPWRHLHRDCTFGEIRRQSGDSIFMAKVWSHFNGTARIDGLDTYAGKWPP